MNNEGSKNKNLEQIVLDGESCDEDQCFLRDHRHEHKRCHHHGLSSCSDMDHCDGRDDGHCNGHSNHLKHPCHDFDCCMKSLGSNCGCGEEC